MEPVRVITDLAGWETQLGEALKHDFYGLTVDALKARVAEGRYLALHLPGPACAVLELKEFQGEKAMNIIALTGYRMPMALSEWVKVAKRLALEQGCRRIVVGGRPGWVRALKAHGYKLRSTLLEMEFTT